MDKDMVHACNGILPAIERNRSESSVEMWMDPESIMQNKVSWKEKNKYRELMHVCGI